MLDLEVLMMKRYINYSIVYAVLALVAGVFYREFTKIAIDGNFGAPLAVIPVSNDV